MDSKSLNILDIRLREVGQNGTSKVNTQTNTRTHGQTDGHLDLQKVSAKRADALKNPNFLKNGKNLLKKSKTQKLKNI